MQNLIHERSMYSVSTPHKTQKPQQLTKKTLDVQHSIKVQQFQEKASKTMTLQEIIAELKADFDSLMEKRIKGECTEEDIKRSIELQDEIIFHEKQLRQLEVNADEIDYLLNIGDTLFKYYDIVDKGMIDENVISSKEVTNNSILKYLMKPSNDTDTNELQPEYQHDKAYLLEKYLSFTESNYVKTVGNPDAKEICPVCNSNNRNVMLNDGIVYCNECHTVEHIIVDHDRPSYKDPPREVSYFSYKRVNHLNELIYSVFLYLILNVLKNKN